MARGDVKSAQHFVSASLTRLAVVSVGLDVAFASAERAAIEAQRIGSKKTQASKKQQAKKGEKTPSVLEVLARDVKTEPVPVVCIWGPIHVGLPV
jgi:hypothetical protein